MPRFQVPPPLRGFRGSEVSEVIWTLKLIGTVTELGRWRVPRDTVGRAWRAAWGRLPSLRRNRLSAAAPFGVGVGRRARKIRAAKSPTRTARVATTPARVGEWLDWCELGGAGGWRWCQSAPTPCATICRCMRGTTQSSQLVIMRNELGARGIRRHVPLSPHVTVTKPFV